MREAQQREIKRAIQEIQEREMRERKGEIREIQVREIRERDERETYKREI